MSFNTWQLVVCVVSALGLGYAIDLMRGVLLARRLHGESFREAIAKILEAIEVRFLRHGLDPKEEISAAMIQVYGSDFEKFLKSQDIQP